MELVPVQDIVAFKRPRWPARAAHHLPGTDQNATIENKIQAFYQPSLRGHQKNVMRGASNPNALRPGINGFAADQNKRLPYDPEAAKKLLAGRFPQQFPVTMNCPMTATSTTNASAKPVSANLARINVKINLAAETKGTYFPKFCAATPALACWTLRHLRRAITRSMR